MKTVIAFLTLIIASSVMAVTTPRLLQIDCNLANGVKMVSWDSSQEGLKVNTELFGIKKEFKVGLDKNKVNNQYVVNLFDKDSTVAYFLYLPLDIEEIYQEVSGTMNKMNPYTKKPQEVTKATCRVIMNSYY